MKSYKERPREVMAVQVSNAWFKHGCKLPDGVWLDRMDGMAHTKGGVAKVGEWVVYVGDKVRVMTDSEFRARYE